MQIVRNINEIKRESGWVLTLGTFDGIHLGHRRIIDEVLHISGQIGLKSILLTFDPHPREIIRTNNEQLFLLSTINERLQILNSLGLDVCLVLPFTRNLSMLSAEQFFQHIIVESIGAKHIVVGTDHAFGRGRSGNVEELSILGKKFDIGVTIVPGLDLYDHKVSSTAIRKALLAGKVQKAANLLGRPYSISGVVERGDGLGSELGFPTANIHVDSNNKLLPLSGVYAVQVKLEMGTYFGMMNIGKRPTISDQSHISIEVHVFDFSENIFGVNIDVHILERIRDEIRFESREQLTRRLHEDERIVRELLSLKKPTTITN